MKLYLYKNLFDAFILPGFVLLCFSGTTILVCIDQNDVALQLSFERYTPIQKLLDCYTRPITVAILGADDIHIPFYIARDYDACVVVITEDKENAFEKACRKNCTLLSMLLLKKRMGFEDVQKLSECEHFDVVIVFDNLHTFFMRRRQALQSVLRLADFCFLECVTELEQKNEHSFFHEVKTVIETHDIEIVDEHVIASNDEEIRSMLLCKTPKTEIIRKSWQSTYKTQKGEYVVTSNFREKFLYKSLLDSTSEWVAGINLYTFKMLGGVYPSRIMITSRLKQFRDLDHNDLNPCNMVIQGQKIIPIDFNDPRRNANKRMGYERLMTFFS